MLLRTTTATTAGAAPPSPPVALSPPPLPAEATAPPGTAAATRPPLAWPDAVAYQEAVQNPQTALSDSELSRAQIVQNRRGLPLAYSGRFAVVFRLRARNGDEWALRCFTPAASADAAALAARYAHLGARLARLGANGVVPFRFLKPGVRVGSEWFPVVALRWAAGDPLATFVERRLHEPATLVDLCIALSGLRARLERADIAHGDWQHDNLLVAGDGKTVTLVDYDAMWAPELAACSPPPEQGHANYQHPQRAPQHWGPMGDRFAHLVLQTGLLALSHDASLWSRLDCAAGECVLFRQSDFEQPGQTLVWQMVRETARAAGDDLLGESLARLEAACRMSGPAGVLLPNEGAQAAPRVSPAYRAAALRRQERAETVLRAAAAAAVPSAHQQAGTAAQPVAARPLGRFHAELTGRKMRALETQHVWLTRALVLGYAGLMAASGGGNTDLAADWLVSQAVGLPLIVSLACVFWPRRKLRVLLEHAVDEQWTAAQASDDLLDAKRRRLREIDATPYLSNLDLFVRAELDAVSIKRAGKIPGIGARTLKALWLAGIETAGDLGRFSLLDAVSERKKQRLNEWYEAQQVRATARFQQLNDERRWLEEDIRRHRREKNDHLQKRENLLHEQEIFPPTTAGAFFSALLGAAAPANPAVAVAAPQTP